MDEIKVSHNIQILNDREKWTPSNCIKNVDFGIVSMSLLAYEVLVHGKPIIIFKKEDYDLESSVNSYSPNIASHNFEDLENKLEKIKLNIDEYNNNLNLTRKKLFTEFKIKNFSFMLQEIYNE